MNYCFSCQVDISESRSIVPHSINSKVMVCFHCGYPINPKDQKRIHFIESAWAPFVITLSTLVSIGSIFVFSLTWWISIILGLLCFLILGFTNNPTVFFKDFKLSKKLLSLTDHDYLELVQSDERLRLKRDVTISLHSQVNRSEERLNYLNALGEMLDYFKQKRQILTNATKRGALDETEYYISAAHMSKLTTMSALLLPKFYTGEIIEWTDCDIASRYLEDVDAFILDISSRRFLSRAGDTDALNRAAIKLDSGADIAFKQSKAYADTLSMRCANFQKLDAEIIKMSTAINTSFEKLVFTNPELKNLLDLKDKAHDLRISFLISQSATTSNISLDMSLDEILKVEGSLVTFVNDFVSAESYSEFWSIIKEFDAIIAEGQTRPFGYGRNKDIGQPVNPS